MRTSKRTHILQTIVSIIEESGVGEVTYENVSARANLSKSGLVYHFSSREEMIRAVHEFMAERWEQELIDAAGAPAEQLSIAEKLRANLAVSLKTASRAEFVMSIDSAADPELHAIWASVINRWSPSAAEITENPRACLAYLVQLASDGLWAHDHINGFRLDQAQREALAQAAAQLIPE